VVLASRGFVHKVAKEFGSKTRLPLEDLCQIGLLAIAEALSTFDPDKEPHKPNQSFYPAWATSVARRAMSDEIAAQEPPFRVPATTVRRARRHASGEPVRDISPGTAHTINQAFNPSSIEQDSERLSSVRDPEQMLIDQEEAREKEEQLEAIMEALGTLPISQARVLAAHFDLPPLPGPPVTPTKAQLRDALAALQQALKRL